MDGKAGRDHASPGGIRASVYPGNAVASVASIQQFREFSTGNGHLLVFAFAE
jgi:hypothetical protein